MNNAFLWMWFLNNQNRQYTDCDHKILVDLVYALASEVQDLKSQLNGGNPHFGTITCKRWQVVDNDGKVRIGAGTLADGEASVYWWDKDGKARIAAATNADGQASVQWNDTDGKMRIGAATLADGNANLVWWDTDGKVRINAATLADGTVELPKKDLKPK